MPGTGKITAKQDRDAWREAVRHVQEALNNWERVDDAGSGVEYRRLQRKVGEQGKNNGTA